MWAGGGAGGVRAVQPSVRASKFDTHIQKLVRHDAAMLARFCGQGDGPYTCRPVFGDN